MSGRRHGGRLRLRLVRVTMGAAGAVFLAVTLGRSWREGISQVDVEFWRLVWAAVLLLGAGICLARSWAAVLRGLAPDGSLSRSYLRAQPAKYIPGGWAQPVSQVVHTADRGADVGRATAAYPVQAICLMVAGAVLSSGLAFTEGAPPGVRWISIMGPVSVVLLWRRWMVGATTLLGETLRKVGWGQLIPPQDAIVKCFVWSVAAIGLMAGAFAVLAVGAFSSTISPLGTALAFSLAWVAGYIAVPFPAGVGVREAILMVVLGGAAPASVAVGLSVVHRVLQMVAEMALAVASRLKWPRQLGASTTGQD